jgi:TonB family protein
MPILPIDTNTGKARFGRVVLRVTLDKTGAPEKIRVVKGDRVLAAAARDAVQQWRWEPVKLNGNAIEVETMVTVNFEPR